MESNSFNDDQIKYMYTDDGFFKFLNDYFSSYNTCIFDIDYSIQESDYQNWKIYLRIVLANIDHLLFAIKFFEQHSTFSYKKIEKTYINEIHGHLNYSKYLKNKSKNNYLREYPCFVKTKSSITPENIFVLFILNQTYNKLSLLQNLITNNSQAIYSTELSKLNVALLSLSQFIKKPILNDCYASLYKLSRHYSTNIVKKLQSDIILREKKGKIIKFENYKKIFDWYEKFGNNQLARIDNHLLNTLRYDNDFSNKLFELWCLYSINKTFIDEFDSFLLEKNNILKSSNEYIFKLKLITGGYIEIYYQKGQGIYWSADNKTTWQYSSSCQLFKGIPDITIKYILNEEHLIMIDIKNKIRDSKNNSEEIYKMIGYFDNFKESLNISKNMIQQGFLIFRNDLNQFIEQLDNKKNKRIHTLSVSPSKNEALNKNQFKYLCREILNLQNLAGITSEIMSNYSHKINHVTQDDEQLYKNSIKNHDMIMHFFTDKIAKESLESIKSKLKSDYFPHIWSKMDDETKQILAMSECLYEGITPCEDADYAPICIEYCRALEVTLNKFIFSPFVGQHNIIILSQRNKFYQKLSLGRDLTLGECVYILNKCKHSKFPTIELKNYLSNNVKFAKQLLSTGIDSLTFINENIRRKSAHTSIMTYNDLILARQNILGIGFQNLFYTLLDDR